MKIFLAGYNVDADVLEDLKKTSRSRQDVTPETLSASYARISRDPRPINQLRKIAREEVEKARQSNSTIIFKMGHHSIAEHAVFNFDLIGVSRLALEEIEKFRLCAYTEKSQRYQKLEDDFVVPAEIKGTKIEKDFIATVREQNAFYQALLKQGIEPEDARYITSLAVEGQVGQTINARTLEALFRRFASHPLAEVREIGKRMYKLVEPIAPSIILFTQANDFDNLTYNELRGEGPLRPVKAMKAMRDVKVKEIQLVNYTKNADDMLIAALLHSTQKAEFSDCLAAAKKMGQQKKEAVVKAGFKYAEFYDRPLREFEFVDLTYALVISGGCFGQLKRHRMATLTTQPYDPTLGLTIPPAIERSDLKREFKKVALAAEKTYAKIYRRNPWAAQYVLTNAHRRRVLLKVNARELYHISRLREDAHAQWDIQNISRQMSALAQKVMPQALLFIGGKDRYPEVYKKHFGKPPKVLPQY